MQEKKKNVRIFREFRMNFARNFAASRGTSTLRSCMAGKFHAWREKFTCGWHENYMELEVCFDKMMCCMKSQSDTYGL